jgi:hypothetical protein
MDGGSELEPEPNHFDAAPDWENDAAPSPALLLFPFLLLILYKLYFLSSFCFSNSISQRIEGQSLSRNCIILMRLLHGKVMWLWL